VGQFAVKAGHDEFLRRSEGWFPRSDKRPAPDAGPDSTVSAAAKPPSSDTGRTGSPLEPPMAPSPATDHDAAAPVPEEGPAPVTGSAAATSGDSATSTSNGHIPTVTTLSIPGFDALSASQVVQRLDGLNRSELVSVRAYEASTRGRRTILSRVDQLLDERS
jgi:hypothetical protein